MGSSSFQVERIVRIIGNHQPLYYSPNSPIEQLDAPSQNGHHKLFGNDVLKSGDYASSTHNGCEQWRVNSLLFTNNQCGERGKNYAPKISQDRPIIIFTRFSPGFPQIARTFPRQALLPSIKGGLTDFGRWSPLRNAFPMYTV